MANIRKLAEAAVNMDRLLEVVQEDAQAGFCLACGDEAHGVEPDAEKYRCESCGAKMVYGAEEILMAVSL